MSRIQSSVGLITGIPIEETVNKLMAVAARPRELMVNRDRRQIVQYEQDWNRRHAALSAAPASGEGER